jgi:hypothetical protein
MMAPIPDNQPWSQVRQRYRTPIPGAASDFSIDVSVDRESGLLDQTVAAAKNGDWSRARSASPRKPEAAPRSSSSSGCI